MASFTSSISCSTATAPLNHEHNHSKLSAFTFACRLQRRPVTSLRVYTPSPQDSFSIDKSSLIVEETSSEDQLWASARLRVRSFNQFNPECFGIQDHKKYLAEREFEALKERIAGKMKGFGKVACINATLPSVQVSNISEELCAECKFADDGEERIVVGTLDLNQCSRLPDEITGNKPEGIRGDFARAYLSNVCVAKELHRNGLGCDIVAKSKLVAQTWGISHLYVHAAINNEPAKKLYMKSGFIFENDEPAWLARFLGRPRRILLWIGLPELNISGKIFCDKKVPHNAKLWEFDQTFLSPPERLD